MKKYISLLFLFFATTCFAAQDVNVVPLDNDIRVLVVNVTSTATPIPTTAFSGRSTMAIENLEDTVIYLGNSTVTADMNSTGGFQLRKAGDNLVIDLGDSVTIYGIVASGNCNVSVLEVR